MEYNFWSKESGKEFRDTDTIEVSHPALSTLLWTRMAPVVQSLEKHKVVVKEEDTQHERWQCDLEGEWTAEGTNQSILFGRYTQGGHFSPHSDGYSTLDFNHRSMYSVVLYLNDVVVGTGGETVFYAEAQKDDMHKDAQGRFLGQESHVLDRVQARAGRACVFFHNIMHSSVPVDEIKYIIRSDIMFARFPEVCNGPKDVAAFQKYLQATNCEDAQEAQTLFRQAFKMSPALSDIYGI